MRTSSTHASASITANAAEATARYGHHVTFLRADLQTAILLGGEIYDLASLGRTAAPDASPSPSRVN